MDNANLQVFISDVVSEITQKKNESQQAMDDNSSDDFVIGRALAYEEVYELIQARISVYGITLNDD